MTIDTKQKRMSALNVGCPWRGPLVDAPESGTTQGNRQAALFAYSGILAGVEAPDPGNPNVFKRPSDTQSVYGRPAETETVYRRPSEAQTVFRRPPS